MDGRVRRVDNGESEFCPSPTNCDHGFCLETSCELTCVQSSWTPDVNAMFLECFKIDFSASCGVGKLQRAMTPEYQPYINIFRLEDVGLQDLEKFIWNTGK